MCGALSYSVREEFGPEHQQGANGLYGIFHPPRPVHVIDDGDAKFWMLKNVLMTS